MKAPAKPAPQKCATPNCTKPAMPLTNGVAPKLCLDCWKAQQAQRVAGDLDAL
jgi:hypothetical protein